MPFLRIFLSVLEAITACFTAKFEKIRNFNIQFGVYCTTPFRILQYTDCEIFLSNNILYSRREILCGNLQQRSDIAEKVVERQFGLNVMSIGIVRKDP